MSTRARVFSPQGAAHRRGAAPDLVPGNALFRRLGLGREQAELLRKVHRGLPVGRDLARDTPLEQPGTEAGAGAVHDRIGRLEHGVYT